MNINKFLKTKILFYSVFTLFLMTTIFLILKNEFQNLVLLVLTYFLSEYFSKNISVRLGLSILMILVFSKSIKSVWPWKERENMHSNRKKKQKNKKDDVSEMSLKVKKDINKLRGMMSDPKKMKAELEKEGVQNVDNKLIAAKQEELVEHMNNIEPFIKKAENLLKTFEDSGLMSLIDKLGPILPKNLKL